MRISDWSSDVCSSDLLYQSSCRLPFRKADQTGFNESLNVNVRFCWDLRKTFRPHAEALPILIGSPALLVPALYSNPVYAGKPALLFVLCHLQFFAVDLCEFAVLLPKTGMRPRDLVTDRALLGFWRLENIS